MTEIESPLGKTSSGRGGDKRVLTVDDQSESSFGHNSDFQRQALDRRASAMGGYNRVEERQPSEEELRDIEARRAQAIQNRTRISAEARARLEFLMDLGRIKKAISIDGIKFSFQSLKVKEQEEVFNQLAEFQELNALKMQYEIRTHTLARALTHINDRVLEEVIEAHTIEDKVAFIQELDENLVDHLYKWYQENVVKVGQEQYAIKTEEDAKEVLEEIKK